MKSKRFEFTNTFINLIFFIMTNNESFKLANEVLHSIIGGQATSGRRGFVFSGYNAVAEAQQVASLTKGSCNCGCGCLGGGGEGGGSGDSQIER